MAYNKEKLFKQAKELIIEHEHVYFIEDVVSLLPCDKTTFYRLFPVQSNEYNTINDLLTDNKVNKKLQLRKRLGDSEKETGVLALYKLIGTDAERKKLSQSYQEITADVKIKGLDYSKLSDKALEEIARQSNESKD